MNTPAHAVLNLALIGGGPRRDLSAPILLGALLPDLPMFVFYGWERFVLGSPELVIWRDAYFRSHWQDDFFDLFNSVPLALAGLLVAWRLRSRAGLALCASLLLHGAFDLALHREDAHRHFFPFSDWRFASPVSYWDPAHYGRWAALGETLAVLGGSALLWRRHERRGARLGLAAVSALYVAVYVTFYIAGLLPDTDG